MGQLSIPKYDGRSDPTSWLAKAEKIMQANRYEKGSWHIVASLKLKGKASDWYDSVEQKLENWDIFSAQIRKRFSSKSSKSSLLKKLTALQQKKKESLKSYTDKFNMTLARYNNVVELPYMCDSTQLIPLKKDLNETVDIISDLQALHLYIRSLRKSARRHVQYYKPNSLHEAQEAAMDLDDSSDEEENSDIDTEDSDNSDYDIDSSNSTSDSELDETKKSKKSKKIGKILKEISENNKKLSKINTKTLEKKQNNKKK